ncbi:MAG TPA: hypothetical protein DCL54_11375 [Alphaproteobacteria bacterium]|nr:hypothetical protein [Alphaproteobacteria bacterium]HAJ47167.1 hypothetical protein [Alphaproteobacteria bacterium]
MELIRGSIQMRKFSAVDALTIIGSAFSIIGIFIVFGPAIDNILFSGTSIVDSNSKVLISQLFIINICFLAFIVFLVYRLVAMLNDVSEVRVIRNEPKDIRNNEKDIASIFHNICHEARNQIFFNTLSAESVIEEAHIDKGKFHDKLRSFLMFNIYFLDNTKFLFETLTGESCSVCLKFLDVPDSAPSGRAELNEGTLRELRVRTFMRDSSSVRARRETDLRIDSIPARGNTAFDTILNGESQDNFYLCNDLVSDKRYINANMRWKEFYNATLVVPVRIERENGYTVIGFLCIDSKIARFDQERCLEMASAIADLYYTIVHSFVKFLEMVILVSDTEEADNFPVQDLDATMPWDGTPHYALEAFKALIRLQDIYGDPKQVLGT